MAAASPAPSNNSSETAGVAATATATATLLRADTPTKTLRGLNKPKCIQCGNVARSRCPYQCCKSCCAKAQNPCHIHVLKTSVLERQTPTPVPDQQATEPPPPVSIHRVASRPQLQMNAYKMLLTATRSRKPITRKEAAVTNEWRFATLREYKERNTEVENDAFDRYMKNVNSLEEVFSTKSVSEGSTKDVSLSSNPDHSSTEDIRTELISEQKLKLRSNPVRSENVRNRVKQIVDDGLRKLQTPDYGASVNEPDDQNEDDERHKRAKSLWAERASALSDLIDKLNRTRNEEDLKSCMDMKAQLYGQQASSTLAEIKSKDSKSSSEESTLTPTKSTDGMSQNLFARVEIDQESLNIINEHFSSLGKLENL